MGKRGSTAAGATAGVATKKAKTVDTDTSVVGNWVQTKIGDKELSNTEKIGILKKDPQSRSSPVQKSSPGHLQAFG
jgi:hypothetical protein